MWVYVCVLCSGNDLACVLHVLMWVCVCVLRQRLGTCAALGPWLHRRRGPPQRVARCHRCRRNQVGQVGGCVSLKVVWQRPEQKLSPPKHLKAHVRSTLCLRSFSSVAFEIIPVFVRTTTNIINQKLEGKACIGPENNNNCESKVGGKGWGVLFRGAVNLRTLAQRKQ